jgi:hypothetical protein
MDTLLLFVTPHGDKFHNTGYTIPTLAHHTPQLQSIYPTSPSSQGFFLSTMQHAEQ